MEVVGHKTVGTYGYKLCIVRDFPYFLMFCTFKSAQMNLFRAIRQIHRLKEACIVMRVEKNGTFINTTAITVVPLTDNKWSFSGRHINIKATP